MDVSVIQLIATPERFDGNRVRVVGYLHQSFENSGFYLHQADYELSLHRNGLWLSGTCGRGQYAYNNRYVLIEANFSAKDHGHLGLWSGELHDLGRCVPWGDKQPGSASNNSFKPNPLRGSA